MDFKERERKVEHLLRVKFPFSWAPPPITPLRGAQAGIDRGELHKSLMAKVKAERALLTALPAEELEQRFVVSGTEEQAKAKSRAAIEEKSRFFSTREAAADFAYWAKVEYWTLDESIALLLGKSPDVVTWKAIQAYVKISALAKDFERLRNLALRAQAMNRGQTAVYPSAVIAWARQVDIPVPQALQDALAEQRARSENASLTRGAQVPRSDAPESSPDKEVSNVPSIESVDAGASSKCERSLSTDDVIEAFADIGMTSLEWRMALTKNRPKWLKDCIASRGRTGANPVQGRWFPLKIAVALVTGKSRKGAVSAPDLDRAFKRQLLLRDCAEAWLSLREDNPAWGD